MPGKVVPLDALPGLIPDGGSIAIGGSWFCNRPMAALRELVRARRTDLHAISIMGSIDVDLLVGADVASTVTFSMVTLEAFGLAPNFRRRFEDGSLRAIEMTGLTLEAGLNASAHNLPFLPFAGLGSPPTSEIIGLHPELYGTITCPFSGRELLAVRAMRPDVAIVHATRADSAGNAQFDGTFGMDDDIVKAARSVIVTCEEIVPREQLLASPHATRVPGFLVDAVIEAPFGAHPTTHVPLYGLDGPELLAYVQSIEAGTQTFTSYLDQIRNESEAGYRSRVIPEQRAAVLAALVDEARVLTGAPS